MDENVAISYKILRRIQQAEKSSSTPTRIDVNFYKDLSSYIRTIEQSVEKEKNQLKHKLFTEEVLNSKKIANNIYELREKKIVQAALASVRGATPDISNLVEIEKQLYHTIVEQISISRKEIFEKATERHLKEQLPFPPIDNQRMRNSNTNPIVRVMVDTPEFIGTDEKTYILIKEDVLSLPHEMIGPLQKKGVVKQIR